MEQILNNYSRSKNFLLSKKIINVLVFALLCILISTTSNAQSVLGKNKWNLDAIDLKEVSRARAEIPVKYSDIKDIIDCVFQKIEFRDENKCILWDYYDNSHDASYSSTDGELKLILDKKEFNYQYSISNSKMILRRSFNGGNPSGLLVDYNMTLQFSLQN